MDLREVRENNAREAQEVLHALGLTPIWQVYGKEEANFDTVSDYDPLLRSLGADVLVQVDEDNYQGSSYLLLGTPQGQVGFLAFGWGSCSGCDALQHCNSWADVDVLRRRLIYDIKWASDRQQLWLWLCDEEIQTLKWHWGSTSYNEFLKAACQQMFGITYTEKPRSDART